MPRKTKTEIEEKNAMNENTGSKSKEGGKQISLEEAFAKLDQIIDGLEGEDVSLEESFKLYHEGMELLKTCNQSIDKVEKELMILEESIHG